MKIFYLSLLSRSSVVIALLVLLCPEVQAQDSLEDYLKQALSSNLVARNKEISWKQAELALRNAKSYFLPSISLMADYTSGDGGRSIALPVGDLLNPVYASLNSITQSDAFRQIENVNQNFFPNNYYDTRIHTTVPLVNTDLHLNRTINGQKVAIKQYELARYKRQLAFEIKSGYFAYLSSLAAIHIYESAFSLVQKNVEINESLLRNGKSLPANLMRSKSEVERVRSELNNARNISTNAKRYFNFLLNRDLDQDIAIDVRTEQILISDSAAFRADRREEIQMIRAVQAINHSNLRLNKLSMLPKVNAFLDVGSQASNWEWNGNSTYYLFGVQLSIPLFQGFRTATSIYESRLEIEKSALDLDYTVQQLHMAAAAAANDLHTSTQNRAAAMEQLKTAQTYFNLVEKGYQQGVNSLIEFLDARNQLTSSQLQRNVRHYELLTATARLERETASYNIAN
ncbi:MAG: TolC family protein [Chryseolinea sp.]